MLGVGLISWVSAHRKGCLFPSQWAVFWGRCCSFDLFYFHCCSDQTSVLSREINRWCLVSLCCCKLMENKDGRGDTVVTSLAVWAQRSANWRDKSHRGEAYEASKWRMWFDFSSGAGSYKTKQQKGWQVFLFFFIKLSPTSRFNSQTWWWHPLHRII